MKPTFQNIVVGYDGFERKEPIPALAMALAEEHGGALHLVHVLPLPPKHHISWPFKRSPKELASHVEEERALELQALAQPALDRGIEVSTRVVTGVPQLQLILEVDACKADLLIVVDEPQQRKKERGFGSVTKKLLRKCPCPVLALRSHASSSCKRVLAAVDVGPQAPEDSPPNHSVLARAEAMMESKTSSLIVFHAWELWNEHYLRGRGGLGASEVDVAREQEESQRLARLEQLVSDSLTKGTTTDIRLVNGDPRDRLVELVELEEVDLVVMGTVGRTGVVGLVIGNTAEKILDELSCSVLAVKPDDFVSPALRLQP